MPSMKKKNDIVRGKNHPGKIRTNELKHDGKDVNTNKVSRTNLENIRRLRKNNYK